MSKIQQMKTGQVFVLIPKKVFDAMGWAKADRLAWEILGKDKLKLEKVKTRGDFTNIPENPETR